MQVLEKHTLYTTITWGLFSFSFKINCSQPKSAVICRVGYLSYLPYTLWLKKKRQQNFSFSPLFSLPMSGWCWTWVPTNFFWDKALQKSALAHGATVHSEGAQKSAVLPQCVLPSATSAAAASHGTNSLAAAATAAACSRAVRPPPAVRRLPCNCVVVIH